MKRLFIVAISACILFSGQSALFAHPSGINLLSQSHQVRGGTFFNGVLDEYNLTGPAAIEGSSIGANSEAGNYSISAFAYGSEDTNIKGAYACSSYLFRTENDNLNVKLDGYIWCTLPDTSVSYHLKDKTAGTTLDMFSYSGYTAVHSMDKQWPCSYENRLTGLDTSHTYELYLCAIASTGDGGDAVLNAQLSSACQVPVPSAVMLGMVGALITGWMKRRKNLC